MNYGEVLAGAGIGVVGAALGAAWTHLLHLRADRIKRERDAEERARGDLLLKTGAEAVDSIRRLEAAMREGPQSYRVREDSARYLAEVADTSARRLVDIAHEALGVTARIERILALIEGKLSSDCDSREGGEEKETAPAQKC